VDTNTVLRHVARLGLTTPWKARPERARPPRIDRSIMRAAWNDAHATVPAFGRKQLRKRVPAVYTWLYRHDRDWLEAQPPAPVRPNSHKPRINWTAVDGAIAEALRREAAILLTQVPPVPVTRAALERAMGQRGWLEKRLHKLPLCAAILRDVNRPGFSGGSNS
jgi:hypothetical protein